jgi:hypothetical protein
MGIDATFARPDGSTYDVALESDWTLHLADGRTILAEDLEKGDRITIDRPGNRIDVAIKVMGE